MNTMDIEIWKPIKDFENYSVSTFGNIKNNITDKILKLNIKDGYSGVCLKNKERKSFKVHRLVALAFIDNPENKSDVNHKDKNKINNNVSNLEWMTRKENNIHRCKDIVIKNPLKNKPVNRINKDTNEIIETYESIYHAALWLKENDYTKNSHNGRNSIGNCLTGLSKSAHGFNWEYIKEPEILEGELWKEVCIDNKKCWVSSLGRYKNSQNIILANMNPSISGYISVTIGFKTYRLHRLIAQAFINNPENKEQVNHIDGNKINNTVSNLEWVTNQENQIHKHKIGLGNNFTRKIGQYDLNNNLIKEYPSIATASKENNIHKANIQGILKNKRKTAGGFIWKYLD